MNTQMNLTNTLAGFFVAASLLLSLTMPLDSLQAAPKDPKKNKNSKTRKAPKSSIETYLARMLTMQAKSATKNGVKLTVQAVPDAYLYYMAKIYQDYEGLGLSEELLAKKLGSAHTKYKRFQNRLFFKITITGEDGKHVVFDKSLANHLTVTQKSEKNAFSKRTYHPVDVSPKVDAEQWKLFGKRISDYTKKNLFVFKNLRAEVTSFSIKDETTEPIYFNLNEIWTAKSLQKSAGKTALRGGSKGGGKGKKKGRSKGIPKKLRGALGSVTPHEPVINAGEKQISAKMSFAQLKKPGPIVILTPGHWDPPLPPQAFLQVIKQLSTR